MTWFVRAAIERLPEGVYAGCGTQERAPPPLVSFTPPPPLAHIAEGSFFVGDDKTILQVQGGQAVPVTHGDTPLKADGTMTGQRLAALIELRDHARRVLQSQNEGWPEEHRQAARRELNRAYDRFVAAYGPINKTTFATTADGSVIRRMPNLVKFREDPDAMLVMSLEDYDEVTGKAAKAAIMHKDVVGRSPPVTSVAQRRGRAARLPRPARRGRSALHRHALRQARPRQVIAELGDLIYQDPETQALADGRRLSLRQRAGEARRWPSGPVPAYARNAEALRAVQPEDVLPGDIDANLGRAVDTGERHPGLRRRALRRRSRRPSRSAT